MLRGRCLDLEGATISLTATNWFVVSNKMRNDHFADAGKVIVARRWRSGPDEQPSSTPL